MKYLTSRKEAGASRNGGDEGGRGGLGPLRSLKEEAVAMDPVIFNHISCSNCVPYRMCMANGGIHVIKTLYRSVQDHRYFDQGHCYIECILALI